MLCRRSKYWAFGVSLFMDIFVQSCAQTHRIIVTQEDGASYDLELFYGAPCTSLHIWKFLK